MEPAAKNAMKNALGKVSHLKLVPPLCSGSFEGSRTGNRLGGAMEFADYRSYRHGDELRRIDWRLYGRSEQLMVRRFALESDPRCDIIIDCSRSMDFYGKNAAAAGIAAVFAASALNAGFSIQAWGLGESVLKLHPAEEPLYWELPETGSSENTLEGFESLRSSLFRNGVRIFISDLFGPLLPRELIRLPGEGKLIVIQILGNEEIAPSLSGPVSVTDPESGACRTLQVTPEVIERYKENLQALQRTFSEELKACGGSFFSLDASECLEKWDMEPFCREGILQ